MIGGRGYRASLPSSPARPQLPDTPGDRTVHLHHPRSHRTSRSPPHVQRYPSVAAVARSQPSPASARPRRRPRPRAAARGAHLVRRVRRLGAEAKANKAFFEAVLKSVAEKRAANPRRAAVTVVYDASGAPTFAQQIASSAPIWNSAVSNVKLQAGSSGATSRTARATTRAVRTPSTDGHGSGYIFLDYAQNQEYDSTRVTAHETGHVLGLPDHYDGPCSELMSGGGPGTVLHELAAGRDRAGPGQPAVGQRSREGAAQGQRALSGC